MISQSVRFLTGSLGAAIILTAGCTKPGPTAAAYINNEGDAPARTAFYASGRYERYATAPDNDDNLAKRPFETGTYQTNSSGYLLTVDTFGMQASWPSHRAYQVIAQDGVEYLLNTSSANYRKYLETTNLAALRHELRRTR